MRKKTFWAIAVECYGDSTPQKIIAMVERGNALKVTLCGEVCGTCGLGLPCDCKKGESESCTKSDG